MTYLSPVLTIAGTDPSGGAGIMADLKTFQARRTYGMAVVTSVVAQNTCGVRGVQHIETAIIDQQLACVYDDIKPKAVKTGMLAERETISLVASYLKKYPQPYVLDPVMVATSGHRLIDSDAVEALKEDLLPLATIITPNLPEAEILVGYDLSDEVSIIKAGYDIQKQYSVRNVLIKGGHLDGLAKDYLFLEKEGLITLSNQRINTIHTHGTGCTFAAVVAAELAKGQSILNAVSTAKSFITSAIETAPELGLGNGPVNHTSCITNNVVKNFTANGLLALGASPAMSECIEDLEDLLKVANALLINIGTLTKESWQLYQEAIKIANKNQVPVVLDPVAAGASRFRLEVSLDLLKNYSISLLRGNGSEIAALVGEKQASKGADGGKVADLESIAVKANQVFDVPVVVTGETDAIAVRGEVRLLQNGSPLMPLVTGTGCLLGAVLAAFIGSSDRSDDLACLTEAMTVYNVSGEIAEKVAKGKGVGSFQVAFLDALSQMKSEMIMDK
ncbi:TPA: bifunctional hydroxymethylpyrimidine kinase/phosphomethylpyrimidine kinase [Streptococcus agalactiae]